MKFICDFFIRIICFIGDDKQMRDAAIRFLERDSLNKSNPNTPCNNSPKE